MKRFVKPITAGTRVVFQDDIIFKPAELVTLLSEINELKGCAISISSAKGKAMILTVNGTSYQVADIANTIYEKG